jgi:hypothetical protein
MTDATRLWELCRAEREALTQVEILRERCKLVRDPRAHSAPAALLAVWVGRLASARLDREAEERRVQARLGRSWQAVHGQLGGGRAAVAVSGRAPDGRHPACQCPDHDGALHEPGCPDHEEGA